MSTSPSAFGMAWDPKNPSALVLPRAIQVPSQQQDEARVVAMQINTMLSHSGVGCNEHEVSALMQLLDAHQAHSELTPSVSKSWNTLKTLSKAYRAALRECLVQWEDHWIEMDENNNDNSMTEGNNNMQQPALDKENLEMLKLVYAITHLSEIFILPPPPEMTSSLDYYADAFSIPGALTADTVRYLRHHHTAPALQMVDPDVLQELMDSLHPDQVDDGAPYWLLLNTLVKHGNLEQAWALLSRHSACQRAMRSRDDMDDDGDEALLLEKDREAFQDLERLLLSAPLPGGRDDANDAGLDAKHNNRPREETLLEGISTTDYQLWETSDTTLEGTDFPVHYNPRAASTKRHAWQQYVLDLESVHRLARKIPQLDGILKILSGNIKQAVFDNWAEALLAELIYVNPTIVPGNIQVRAEKLMQKYPPVHEQMDDVLLSIMQGSSGRVMESLFAFGGASGAALPATVTSLLCNLYLDAGLQLPKPLQMDLLKTAAFAITSSLAGPNADIGTRMVVRLLLPFATPKGDVSIVATMAAILERHTPGNDVEARNLISLCQKLVDKKSERIVDGCVGLVLFRYRSHLNSDTPGGAMHWLLVGLELESMLCRESDGEVHDWQSIEATSVCYRYIISWCVRVAGALLLGILEEREGVGRVNATAKEMVKSLKEGPLEGYVAKLLEVQTLELMVGIYERLSNDSPDWTPVATNIKLLLQEKPNEYDSGAVTTTAPRCLHYGLLLLGQRVIEEDERRIPLAKPNDYCSSFDVQGVQALLEQVAVIPLSLELEKLHPIPEDLLHTIRLSLAKALSRAFVKENARRKPDWSGEKDEVDVATIRSCDLHKFSIETQERAVQFMLDS
ncbi:expressed unknown protein [Seminavis robusta]|uniref:Nuclear pore complex protein Nup85 n=1 Tax=Seminavis robusta TaxID=568900 RepID=A0A9N8DRV9_9STRA|nr:expressed unknown protein [Seminavis robusta]|eukprot:Sro236_g094970.1 n/a (851) ;mRNA; r:39739-42371